MSEAPQKRRSSFGPSSRIGDVLAGKYMLEEVLGSGGMGDVYRAVNQLVGRAVAIKLLRPEHTENAMVVERFMREARAANLVRHPNVVDVIDIGQDEDGSPFIVQELLVGEDLGRYAARMGGRLSLEDVVDLCCPVIDAVAEAHARGVVHRDIKPENVFLVKTSTAMIPKLLDFGISKVTSPDVRATDAGVMLGTPAYMAPEQLQGAREADARTDVWAIGVMLFELLSGRLPFDAKDAPSLFVSIATTDAPPLVSIAPEVAPTVSRIVARCLRRKPAERYPTAAELARDLRHLLQGTEIEPTGRRSIPPSLANLVPDLLLPMSAPRAPKLGSQELEDAGVDSSDVRALQGRPVLAVKDVETPKPAPALPSLPPLEAPAKKAPPPAPKPRQPSEPELSSGLAEDPRQSSRHMPAAAPAPLPGMMMGGPSQATKPRPGAGTVRAPETQRSESRPDMSWIVGSAIVGLVALIAIGILMQVAHRPQGWAILSFLIQPTATMNAVGQCAFALIGVALGMTYLRRGVRSWQGDAAGGLGGAVISALIGAAALFGAVELASAAW